MSKLSYVPSLLIQDFHIICLIERFCKFSLFTGMHKSAKWSFPPSIRDDISQLQKSYYRTDSRDNEVGFELQCEIDNDDNIYVYKPTYRNQIHININHTLLFVYNRCGVLIDTIRLEHFSFMSLKVVNGHIYILYPNHIVVLNSKGLFERDIILQTSNSIHSFNINKNGDIILLSRRTFYIINKRETYKKVVLKINTIQDKYCPELNVRKTCYWDVFLTNEILILFTCENQIGCLRYSSTGKYIGAHVNENDFGPPFDWYTYPRSCFLRDNNMMIIQNRTLFTLWNLMSKLKHSIFVKSDMDEIQNQECLIATPLILMSGELLLVTIEGFEIWR